MSKKTLTATVQEITNDIRTLEKKRTQLDKYTSIITKRKKDISHNLNFLQKELGFHCMGRKKKQAVKYTAINNMLGILPHDIESLNKSIATKYETLDYTIIHYLTSTDAVFKKFIGTYQEVKKTFHFITYLAEQIKEAIGAIHSAENTETVDLFTDSKTLSFLSSVSNGSAQAEIEKVKYLLPEYKKHIKKIQAITSEYPIEHKGLRTDIASIESMDLVFDLVFDIGFDFSSFASLSSISSAQDELEDIQRHVNDFLEKVMQIKKPMEQKRTEAIKNTKQMLNS